MDPVTIATAAIGILGPYVAKGAEEFVKAAGKDAYEGAKRLFETLKSKWAGKEEPASTLASFEKRPDRYETPLKEVLAEELAKDPALLEDVGQQVAKMGPYIEVIMKMKKGEDIVGLEANEMTKGTAKVSQEIEEGKNVKGAVIGRIG